MRALQRLAITLVAITLLAGLGVLPLSADSITKNGWTFGTPLPPGIVRLAPFGDPLGDSVANAMNDSGTVVGYATAQDGADHGAIWNAPVCISCSETPDLVDPPLDQANAGSDALDVTDSGLVLVVYYFSEIPPFSGPFYEIFDMNTGTWSAVASSPAALGWNHTPSLTNNKGWSIEYGTIYDSPEVGHPVIGQDAFLMETPEPETLALLAVSLVALAFLKSRSSRIG